MALDPEMRDIAEYLAQLDSEDVDWMTNFFAQMGAAEDGGMFGGDDFGGNTFA